MTRFAGKSVIVMGLLRSRKQADVPIRPPEQASSIRCKAAENYLKSRSKSCFPSGGARSINDQTLAVDGGLSNSLPFARPRLLAEATF